MTSSKTLADFFPPVAKRLKRGSPVPPPDSSNHLQTLPKLISSSICRSSDLADAKPTTDDPSSPTLTPEQKSRIEFNKSLAKSRLNLRICSERIANSAAGKGILPVNLKLEELLVEETWLEALPGELHKPYAKKLCEFVEREIRRSCDGTGVPIYPPPHLIFNALNTTPFDRVKAVIIGQDPYHGPGQAMGLSFSVPEGIKIPSSLGNIYKELKEDLNCSIPSHGNLERWALQGVLLLNSVLTVRQHQANSHAKKGWEEFTDAVIQTISRKNTGVVFLLWGNYAQVKSRLIDETKHHILKAAHPSGLSANRGFFKCRHFSRTNQILNETGVSPIDWQL
jgi:uracil-DNA glycosylase